MRRAACLLWVAPLVGLELSAATSPGHNDTPILRLLRSDTQPDEEARLAINFPGANKLVAPVKWTGSKITGKVKVETMRLQGKSADEAFVLLKLDQAGDKLLENKQFSVWVSYMTKTTKKYPENIKKWFWQNENGTEKSRPTHLSTNLRLLTTNKRIFDEPKLETYVSTTTILRFLSSTCTQHSLTIFQSNESFKSTLTNKNADFCADRKRNPMLVGVMKLVV
ncbi:hypothetical protein GQ600_18563 [Phytophthora cactorum]|nr:hypothetical protein GQ600_18563 [Phytophthora cactorum]